jgi:peptide-methionine (R)-S-oxide reductase
MKSMRSIPAMMMTRRDFLGTTAIGLIALAAATKWGLAPGLAADSFEVSYSEDEWRKRLTPQQFEVLRKTGTERPYSSPLNNEHRRGTFACAGCELDLFSSDTKFDSGTGWPSFWTPLDNAVGEEHDTSYGMARTAVHCRRCGGHLGHVFNDGPKPTGLRYCMNGVAMTFKPLAA